MAPASSAPGLIVFGGAWLISSLLPPSDTEGQAAREKADDLREPAQDAVESVKDKAADAATTVKEQGSTAKDQVRNNMM